MASVVISGDTSGAITISAPAVAGTNTLTLPVATDTLVGKTTTDTLTNKTLTSPTLTTPALGTPASGVLTSCTGVNYDGYKNRIINGAMVIDQRNAGGTLNPTNAALAYAVDRFLCYNSTASSKFSIQQSSTAPTGFSKSVLVTSSSAYSVAAGDQFYFGQLIEGFNTADLGFGTASASTVTLSFWVRSSLTGTFGGSLMNSAYNRSYPFSYTISSANTWEQKSITIAGDTSGTWIGATNGTGLRVHFGLGVGSTFSGTANAWASAEYYAPTGATSVVGTNGATFYITGVQLEKGSTATSFDYRPYGTEFMLCQRYYQLADGYVGSAYSSTSYVCNVKFVTAMRASPTVGETGVNTITYPGNVDYTQSSVSISINGGSRVSTTAVQLNLGNFTSLVTNTYVLLHNVGSGSITLSAEL